MYTKCKLLKEGLGATSTTWYEKKMLSKDSMSDIDSNTSSQDEDNFKGYIMDKHEISKMHGNTTNDI